MTEPHFSPIDPIKLPFKLSFRTLVFIKRVYLAFIDNKGPVLAGAIAYNALLSVIPLFLVIVFVGSRFVDTKVVLAATRIEIESFLPKGKAKPVTDILTHFIEHPDLFGWIGLSVLLFFSTLAFRMLQEALDLIFRHRHLKHGKRSLIASVLISLVYVSAAVVVSAVQLLAMTRFHAKPIIGEFFAPLMKVVGFAVVGVLLTSVYIIMPVGRTRMRLAVAGGFISAILWEIIQGLMAWYFENMSMANIIYGSLGAVVLILISLEMSAILVLVGAQIIAEIEQSWDAELHWWEKPDKEAHMQRALRE